MAVVHIETLAAFDRALGDAGSKLVVVDFFAVWCPPCKVIAPKVEELAKANTDVVFLKVDVDEAEEVGEKMGISAMPTFHFYKANKLVHSFVGADERALVAKVAELK